MKNGMVQELIKLQKQGTRIHLTEDGWKVFVELIGRDIDNEENTNADNELAVG
jgi:hypothetical protein